MDAKVIFPFRGAGKVVPRGLEELVEFGAGIGHAVIVPDVPSIGSFDETKDVAYLVEKFLKESADASAGLVGREAGRKVAGPALQAAIYAYRLAQYAMLLEERRILVAASQPQ